MTLRVRRHFWALQSHLQNPGNLWRHYPRSEDAMGFALVDRTNSLNSLGLDSARENQASDAGPSGLGLTIILGRPQAGFHGFYF